MHRERMHEQQAYGVVDEHKHHCEIRSYLIVIIIIATLLLPARICLNVEM